MMASLVDNLIGSAVLMAIVLIIRRPVARAFGARAAFALWTASLVRLLVPPLPVDGAAPDIFIQTRVAAANAVEPVRAAFPVNSAVMAIWAAGTLLFLAFHLARYLHFVALAQREARPLPGAAGEDIEVLETAAVSGPAAAGLLRRRIFVPQGFARHFAADEQHLALKHELLHHRRGDLWASAAALLVLSVHWFNPLAYAAHRAFRRDLEGACDADLLAGAPVSERQAYARTILRCVARPIPQPICALTDCKELKGRLNMMKHDTSLVRRLGGAASAMVLTAGGLLMAMPAGAQQAEPKQRIEMRKVILTGPDGKETSEWKMTPEIRAKIAECRGQKFEANTNGKSADGKVQHQKIMICAKTTGESKAQFADTLQKALDRIQSESDMNAEGKAEIVARLKEKIAELRAGQ